MGEKSQWSLTIWGPMTRRNLRIEFDNLNIPDDEMNFIVETIGRAAEVMKVREMWAKRKIDTIPEEIYPGMQS